MLIEMADHIDGSRLMMLLNCTNKCARRTPAGPLVTATSTSVLGIHVFAGRRDIDEVIPLVTGCLNVNRISTSRRRDRGVGGNGMDAVRVNGRISVHSGNERWVDGIVSHDRIDGRRSGGSGGSVIDMDLGDHVLNVLGDCLHAVGVTKIQECVDVGESGGRVLGSGAPEVFIHGKETVQGVVEVKERTLCCLVFLRDESGINRIARHPCVYVGGAKLPRSCDRTADNSATFVCFLDTDDSMEVSADQRGILGVNGAPKKVAVAVIIEELDLEIRRNAPANVLRPTGIVPIVGIVQQQSSLDLIGHAEIFVANVRLLITPHVANNDR